MAGAMGSHQSTRAMTTTWLTPPFIVEALGPFDMDPCAAPSPRPWPTAARHVELPEDGLAVEWAGRVWLNPPYSNEAWRWLAKLAEHGDGIALVFARTETSGFVREVWGKATALLFLHGRLFFHRPDGEKAAANSGAPSVLVAYGAGAAARLQASGLDGTYVPLRGAREGVSRELVAQHLARWEAHRNPLVAAMAEGMRTRIEAGEMDEREEDS
jgi:hypothetical protein